MSVVGTALFALSATRAHASYDSFVMYFMLASVGGGMAYVAWIASFTETVEKRNPAATPVGLAVWGWTLRLVVTVSLIALTQVVPATTTLVEKGSRIAAMGQAHPQDFAIVTGIDPKLAAEVQNDPSSQVALATLLSQTGKALGATASDLHGVESVVRSGELAAVQVVAPSTMKAMQEQPTDTAAQEAAVAQIAAGLQVDTASAARLLTGC